MSREVKHEESEGTGGDDRGGLRRVRLRGDGVPRYPVNDRMVRAWNTGHYQSRDSYRDDDAGLTFVYCTCGAIFDSGLGEYSARRKLAKHIEECSVTS